MLISRTIPNVYKEAVDVDKKVKRNQIVADEDEKKTGLFLKFAACTFSRYKHFWGHYTLLTRNFIYFCNILSI